VNYIDLWGLEKNYSESLVDFVKQAEDFVPHLYDDKNPSNGPIQDISTVEGSPTIGYGHNTEAHNDTALYLGRTITEQEADTILRSDLNVANRSLNNPEYFTHIDNLSQQQFDALIDRYFHNGSGNIYSDPLVDLIADRLADNLPVVTDTNRSTIRDNFIGNATAGELNRRQNQAQLFLNGDYNGSPSDPSRGNLCGH
jgi:GH24 family phage-related lysozyme (muramidase)